MGAIATLFTAATGAVGAATAAAGVAPEIAALGMGSAMAEGAIVGGGAAATGAGVGAAAAGLGGSALLQGAGSAVASSLLSPKPPKIPGALPMPDPVAQAEARRRSIAEQQARAGRASTILTQPVSEKLGG